MTNTAPDTFDQYRYQDNAIMKTTISSSSSDGQQGCGHLTGYFSLHPCASRIANPSGIDLAAESRNASAW